MSEFKTFLHKGSIGDVWAAVPAMKQFYKNTGKKAMLYLASETRAVY